ncbi:hypothetical protein J2Z32_004329 [Paenibacillus turicensis]|uniref:Uncharacterized protein n=1 Tax=Paenibacillus turicensis TaxID=160487 RepID=A0ABS4FYU4_9BACL|nr:hypothetical protein [Paenibacillus turicensis]MBP1907649.1 hypothetical protein [Paenibacillus turicensis]
MGKNSTIPFKLIISILIILVPTLYFGCIGKSVEMGIALAAGALSTAFLNLDKLQRFKGAGIEVELKQAVAEAQATLDNLKDFTVPLYIFSIKNMTEGLTWEGITDIDKHIIVRKMEKIALENKIDSDVRDAIDSFYSFNLKGYFENIRREVQKYYKEDIDKQLFNLADYTSDSFPTESQIRNTLNALDNIPTELEQSIFNYAYYKDNKFPPIALS